MCDFFVMLKPRSGAATDAPARCRAGARTSEDEVSPKFPPPWGVCCRPVPSCAVGGTSIEVACLLGFSSAPVAQLDRVSPSEGEGHRFESCRVRQLHQKSLIF
jgi:hypothetical protein